MRLTTKARYAVMAIVDLASMEDRGPVKLADIAERQEISLSYLEQLFARLRRAGIVASTRGPGGGYQLAGSRDDISIADIVYAVDEPIRATRCVAGTGRGCRRNAGRCQTHDLWEGLGDQIQQYLKSVSVDDVVSGRLGAASNPLSRESAGGVAPLAAE